MRRTTVGAVFAAALTSLALFASPCGADETSANATPANAAGVIVIKATTKCFTSIIHATGYIVPRAPAVVMFNAPGYRVSKVAASDGDTIVAEQTVAEVASSGTPNGSMDIKSVAGGLVLSRTAEVGMPTSASAPPLFTIAIDGVLEAAVDIPSIHVLDVAAGQPARISTDDGQDFEGRVRLTPTEIGQKTQMGQARIAITSGEPAMVGRFVRVAIDTGRSCGIAVPRAALTHGSDGIRVQVVHDETVETRQVLLGALDETDAYVASGVNVDDLVIADAGTSLRTGDRVKPILADP